MAYEVAAALNAPLDVIVVRKLGAPGQPELGIGAVVDGDHPRSVLNEDVLRVLAVSEDYLQREVARRIKLRYTPHLRFVYDESVARGDRIERLLKEAKAKDAAPAGPPPPEDEQGGT